MLLRILLIRWIEVILIQYFSQSTTNKQKVKSIFLRMKIMIYRKEPKLLRKRRRKSFLRERKLKRLS